MGNLDLIKEGATSQEWSPHFEAVLSTARDIDRIVCDMGQTRRDATKTYMKITCIVDYEA